ncbi:MAG: ROK family protein [Actinomycetota bacterium]
MTTQPESSRNGVLACVEVGGGSTQTVVFDSLGRHRVLEGACQPDGASLALAVPGIVSTNRVVAASNLGWLDVDPLVALHLPGPARVLCNDAEAAALGEAALREREGLASLVYVGIGTGVGGAVVADGHVVAANLFGHTGGFGSVPCPCGQAGCLETVAAGWALPKPIDPDRLATAAEAIARAVSKEPIADPCLVVVGGGVARRYPELIGRVQAHLPGRIVEPSRAPSEAKSAAAWGLRHLVYPERRPPVT